MAAYLAVFAAFALGGLLCPDKASVSIVARLVRCSSGVCLFAEFVLPYRGGGASMWPIALIFGGLYGAIAGAIGIGLVTWLGKDRDPDDSPGRPPSA